MKALGNTAARLSNPHTAHLFKLLTVCALANKSTSTMALKSCEVKTKHSQDNTSGAKLMLQYVAAKAFKAVF